MKILDALFLFRCLEDFEFDEETQIYHYPCPCGDRFEITLVSRYQSSRLSGFGIFERICMLYIS